MHTLIISHLKLMIDLQFNMTNKTLVPLRVKEIAYGMHKVVFSTKENN